MALINWDNGFSVGIEEIDEQHKKWIGIINELDEALMASKGRAILGEIFKEMVDYTTFHFAEEEKLLQEVNYPDFVNHKTIHNTFKERIRKYQKDFLSEEIILSSQVMSVLKNWLQDHILVEDKKYSEYL